MNKQSKQGRYKENGHEHCQKNTEASSNQQSDQRYIPYMAKKVNTKDQFDSDIPRPRFKTFYRLLMTKEDVVDKL